MRKLAQRLIAHEASRSKKSSEPNDPWAFPVIDKLRPLLASLMGNEGFRALLARALVLASPDHNWLRAAHVKADGSFEGLKPLHEQLEAKEFLEGRVVLLARFLGLLVALIGENLTLGLLRDVWPEV